MHMWPVGNAMAIAMRDMEINRSKNLGGSILPIMATERSKGAPRSLLCAQYAYQGNNIRLCRFTMRMKAMQPVNVIGKDLGGIIAIALGDVPWMNRILL